MLEDAARSASLRPPFRNVRVARITGAADITVTTTQQVMSWYDNKWGIRVSWSERLFGSRQRSIGQLPSER